MKKLCFILLFLWGAAAKAQAPQIYITPTGTTTGSCPIGANTHNPAFFNSAANWGTGAGQIGPGTVVLICGTFTGAAGGNMLTTQGPGTSGHPVTILFDTNAVLTSPYWGLGVGAINCNQPFITIDGGTNGLITNSANGDGLANSKDSEGIFASSTGCSNFIVKNVRVANLHVKIEGDNTVCNDNAHNNPGYTVIGIHVGASNQLVTHNFLDHVRYGVYGIYTPTAISNIEISYNLFTFTESSTIFGDGNTNSTLTGLLIHDNHYAGGNYLWDSDSTTVNCFHHNGDHIWSTAAGSQLTGLKIYNNLFDGTMGRDTIYAASHSGGSHISGVIFLESVGDGAQIFNNIIATVGTLNNPDNGYIYTKSSGTPNESSRNASIYNNTIVSASGGTCADLESTGALWKNNICSGLVAATFIPNNGSPANYLNSVTADYNDYYQGVNFGKFDTWAGWQSKGEDPNGTQVNPNLNGVTFVPNVGSPIISTGTNPGTNLTGLGIAALNLDKNGNARPASGNWTMGALNFVTSGGTPLISISPASNNFGSVTQNVTSSPVTFTISNPGTANLILGSTCCSTSGTNGTDFVISGQTCANNQVIAPAGTCTVTVVFTPKTIGAETGILQIGSNATSGGNANLSGTGTAPGVAVANVTPNPVNFGNVTTGTTSPIQTVTLNNTGTANLTLGNPTFFTVVAPWAKTGGTCSAGQILTPGGASCTFTLTFTPSTTGAQTSTFTVLGNVNGTTTLNGTGVAPGVPSLTITPAAFSFGNQLEGTASPLHNFTIQNVGGAAATFGPSFFSFTGGSDPLDFARVSPGGSDCTNGGVLLAGATCLISVAFTPTMVALESTGLNILSNAPTVSSSLTGTGIFPALTITPSPIAFGSINQGVASPGKVVTIQNTGTAPETFTGTPITVTGPSGAYFAPSAITCSGTLAINATCTATITFTPGAAGSFTDTFNVNGNGTGTAPLTGTGIAINPVITLAPRPVIFPSTPTSATSSQVTVTVSNATGTASEVLSNPFFTITTGDSADFVRVGGTCYNGDPIAAGASCTIIFTFTPTGAPRLEQTLLSVNGTVSTSVAMQGLGLSVNSAPIPWSIVSNPEGGEHYVELRKVTFIGVQFFRAAQNRQVVSVARRLVVL